MGKASRPPIFAGNPKKKNLVFKSSVFLKKEYSPESGVEIKIKKNIPIASGLAGGSTDAAAVIKGLNELWDINLSEDELKKKYKIHRIEED